MTTSERMLHDTTDETPGFSPLGTRPDRTSRLYDRTCFWEGETVVEPPLSLDFAGSSRLSRSFALPD